MKYQIIVESNEVLADDEFQKIAQDLLDTYACVDNVDSGFKLLYAQNLEGIRKELWEKKDKLKDNEDLTHENLDNIDSTFDEISELFKL